MNRKFYLFVAYVFYCKGRVIVCLMTSVTHELASELRFLVINYRLQNRGSCSSSVLSDRVTIHMVSTLKKN